MYNSESVISLAHGSGGKHTHQLITEIFQKHFSNPVLDTMSDAANVVCPSEKMIVSTDSYVVTPIIFAGGDIGKLSICGTANDISVAGGIPKYITAAFILEEGLEISILDKISSSMAREAKNAGILVIAGDTKVVEKNKGDQIFITTTGFGQRHPQSDLGYHKIRPGDHVIINGPIGDHGISILSKREELSFKTPVQSDARCLSQMITRLLDLYPSIRFMRDPTRGGAATALAEIASSANKTIMVQEENIPVNDAVKGACELMGMDPLYIANEGKVIIICPPEISHNLITKINASFPEQNAVRIGTVHEGQGKAILKSKYGGTRTLDLLADEILPRIC